LGILFPAFFKPRHPLAFRNHQALIDTFQLWLLTMVLLELLKKPSERSREWLKKLIEKRMGNGEWQTTIDKYFHPK
jgi:hypothetical protein